MWGNMKIQLTMMKEIRDSRMKHTQKNEKEGTAVWLTVKTKKL